MNLKDLKFSFFEFLKRFNENEVSILMNYLTILIDAFNNDYYNFKEILNEENSGVKLAKYKNWIDCLDDDIFGEVTKITDEYRNDQAFELNSNSGEQSINSESESEKDSSDETDSETNKSKYNMKQFKKPPHIVDYLNKKYEENTQPTREQYDEMAKETKLNIKQVAKWFQDKRARSKSNFEQSKFTQEITDKLIEEYELKKYLTREESTKIADQLKITSIQVEAWFKHRRARLGHSTKVIAHSKKDVEFLIDQYEINRNPSKEDLEKMLPHTKLTYKQIYKWFSDHRYKLGHKGHGKKNPMYSNETNDYLWTQFKINKYPERRQKEEFASVTKLSLHQIEKWFWRRRHSLNAKNDIKT